jgi:hypothetical protein
MSLSLNSGTENMCYTLAVAWWMYRLVMLLLSSSCILWGKIILDDMEKGFGAYMAT